MAGETRKMRRHHHATALDGGEQGTSVLLTLLGEARCGCQLVTAVYCRYAKRH